MNDNLPDMKEYKKYNYKLTPFKLCVLQNFPYIEADFDAITNYQLLCKVVEYLNHVIDNQNTVEDNFNIMAENLTTLYNFLDTLDLQDEVNNKLDEMVEDGTFDVIVNNVLSIYDTYNFHTLFASEYYHANSEFRGMQGGCVLPDGTIIQLTGDHDIFTGSILHYSQNGALLNSKTVNYGHCNGVTYCEKTNSVFITSTQNDDIGRYMIFEIDINTLDEISRQDLSDKNFPDYPYGIVYIKENNTFIFCNYWYENSNKYIWKTDENFNIIDTKLFDIDVRSTSNIGRFGNYIGINTISSSKIMLFNYNTLDYFREISINEIVSDTWFITEIEWFDTKNDKIYLGFIPFCSTTPRNWGGGTKVIAEFDKTKNYEETSSQNTQFPPIEEIYYINENLPYNPLRNGSYSKPFNNIYEALNSSLRNKNVTGNVRIYLLSNEEESYIPLFSMNKSYNIYNNTNNPIISWGSIAISTSSKVFINSDITFTNGHLNNLYSLGQSHIQLRGNLIIQGTILDSNNERIILSTSGESFLSMFFTANSKLDISNFYGILENRTEGIISVQDLIYPLIDTTSRVSKRIKNFNLELQSDNNEYQLPLVSSTIIVKIRFALPDGTDTLTREESLLYTYGNYQKYVYFYYDSNNAKQTFSITISNNGKITLNPSGNNNDVSNIRIRIKTV